MIAKEITYSQLDKAIEIAFMEDKHIYSLYDPNVKIETVQDIVWDIPRKIKGFNNPILRGVYERDELIGYFVYQGKMLISFSMAMKYRTRKYLREFFNLINKELKGEFVCYLWKRNLRAIKWLQKNGLEVFDYMEDVAKLCSPVKEIVYN
jgi:hypothetical protein